ncbi:Metallo-dependent phosphatase [Diaporthe amygdali]|uniref:Metallo-dependent phosphatase n=1 Tax=Phomopsis amygdali TaxID=1214568 RepID=UPI0022FE8D6D|nr:Metallo-dependent phosphatase [Diaporthe amygdali]KAJ0117531.1 Metallo-dependent phosphatase [Diaporthe amygdali]
MDLAFILVVICQVLVSSAWPELHFSDDQTFHITIFEDLHFGEGPDTDWGPRHDANTLKTMKRVLEDESPELVVLNGDLITGADTFKENSTDYVDMIVAPIVEAGLPWASTYGNHDSDFNLSRKDIYSREKTYENSLTGCDVNQNDSGVSNYYLPVYTNDTSSIPVMILWFFDSGGGRQQAQNGAAISRPDWVDGSVVSWFEETRDQLQTTYGTAIPSLAFFHIPVRASAAFQSAAVNSSTAPGINADGQFPGQGSKEQDTPLMQALLNSKNLTAAFSGHQHGDDWCFKWDKQLSGMNLIGDGLNLCFSRRTGYGGYGDWKRGSRQILVSLESLGNSVETWNRLEDGSVSGEVTLNSTFGTDNYPLVQS